MGKASINNNNNNAPNSQKISDRWLWRADGIALYDTLAARWPDLAKRAEEMAQARCFWRGHMKREPLGVAPVDVSTAFWMCQIDFTTAPRDNIHDWIMVHVNTLHCDTWEVVVMEDQEGFRWLWITRFENEQRDLKTHEALAIHDLPEKLVELGMPLVGWKEGALF